MPRITHNLTSVSPITPTHWRSTHRTHTQPDRHVHIPIRGMTFSNEKPHSEHGFCRQNVALCRINLAWCPNQTRATALIEPMKLHGLGRMWLRAGSIRPKGKSTTITYLSLLLAQVLRAESMWPAPRQTWCELASS